jgi:hypothetical protein
MHFVDNYLLYKMKVMNKKVENKLDYNNNNTLLKL